ncbi:hypothetical protein J4466_01820 [Candidatus Pacearchaeota archaeon]|nr:hypothetical protein [Candidatus Pacearchaeota archaeon]
MTGHIVNITNNTFLIERTGEKPAGIWSREITRATDYEKADGKTLADYMTNHYRRDFNIEGRFRKG